MDKEQAFAMIEQAKERELTDGEVASLGEWAASAKAEPITQVEGGAVTNSLVEWITQFTKQTRPTPLFSTNFKKVNKAVMPHVVAVFELTAPKR